PVVSTWDVDDVLTRNVREPGESGFQLNESYGRILGEEAIRAAAAVGRGVVTATIWSASKEVTCPGSRYDSETGKRLGSDPQTLHMDLLTINDIAFAGVAAEVVTNIYLRLKRESPLT